ncbi:MAG: C39 family peptidase [Nitrospirota bacterium]|nr:C39 family peptidase [Nitrospirota bacterium]
MIVLASCGTTSRYRYAEDAVLIRNVPFFPQEENQCGPASLAGVLNYWGVSVYPEEISREIYSEPARGTLNIDMLRYAMAKGLDASRFSGNMDILRRSIKSGLPVIVLVDRGFYVYQSNHFMVVTGYNKDGVIVNSGRKKETFIPEEAFVKSWKRTEFWMLLINGPKE